MCYGPQLLVLLLFITLIHGETKREKKVDKLLDKIGESIAKEAAGLTEELTNEVKRENVDKTHVVSSFRHHHLDENGLRDEEPLDQGEKGKNEVNTRVRLQERFAEALGTKPQQQYDLSKVRFEVGQQDKEKADPNERGVDKDYDDDGGDDEGDNGETEFEFKIKHKDKKGSRKDRRKDSNNNDALLNILEDDLDFLGGGNIQRKSHRENNMNSKKRHKMRKIIKSSDDDDNGIDDDDTMDDEETRRTIEDGLMTSAGSKSKHVKKPKLSMPGLTYKNVDPSHLKSALSAHKEKQKPKGGTDKDEDYEDDEIGDLRLKQPIEEQVEEPVVEKMSLIISNENASDAIEDTEDSGLPAQNNSQDVASVVILEPVPPKPVPSGDPNASTTPYLFTLPSKDDTSLHSKRGKHERTRYVENGDDLSLALEEVGGRRRGKHRGENTEEKLKTALRNVDTPGRPKAEKTVRKELSHELSRDSFPKPGRYSMLNVEGSDKDEDYTIARPKTVFSKVEVGTAGKIHGEALDDLDVREEVPALEQPEDNSPIVIKGQHDLGSDDGEGSLDDKLEREKKQLQEEESRLVNKLSLLERRKQTLEHRKRWRRHSSNTRAKLRKLYHKTRGRSVPDYWQKDVRLQRKPVSPHIVDHVSSNTGRLRRMTEENKLGHLINDVLHLQRERRALLQYLRFRRLPSNAKRDEDGDFTKATAKHRKQAEQHVSS